MPDGEDENGVVFFFVAEQGQIAGFTSRDDQLTQIVLDRPADQRMVFENLHGFCDEVYRVGRPGRIGLEQEVCQCSTSSNARRE